MGEILTDMRAISYNGYHIQITSGESQGQNTPQHIRPEGNLLLKRKIWSKLIKDFIKGSNPLGVSK